MARRPAWQYTLDEARRQALIAIDFYNRPGDRRSLPDFIVHAHLAWQNLIHADRMQRGAEIHYRNADAKRTFVRTPDGSKKTWDLSRCLKEEFAERHPVRVNLEFFIGLRNHVEHRFQDAVLVVTAAEAHACIINFEHELTRRFGRRHSLDSELKFPVFIQSLDPARFDEQVRLRRALPAGVSSFITQFHAEIPDDVRSDERFSYRLLLLPMKGPKTEADMALNFVRQDNLTPDELADLVGRHGSVVFAEKYRDAVHLDGNLPKAAAAHVQSRIGLRFTVNDFTTVRKKWEIGPARSRDRQQLPNSDGYCAFAPAFGQFVYTSKLIDRMASELATETSFVEIVGRPAIPVG